MTKQASGRILAIDYGSRRIGVAISDPGRMIAQVLEPPIAATSKAVKEVVHLIKKYQIALVLIGSPKNLSGNMGGISFGLADFSRALHAASRVPITEVDERFTTVLAHRLLHEQNLSHKQSRELVDNAAAQVILQQYLDTLKKT